MKQKILIIATMVALPLAGLAEKTAPAEKSAYLGIAMTDPSPALKEQLGIASGVVVADIAADSPAVDALKKHDILTRFNDQILFNSDQMSALLKNFKGGDRVTIEFVRGGKTASTDIVLGEKEKTDDVKTEAMPGVFFDGRNAQLLRNLGIDLDKLRIDPNQIPGGNVNTQSSSSSSSSSVSSTVWSENGTTYQMTSNNGNRTVKITEGGRVVFEGPLNNDRDKAKIPAEFLRRIEKIQGDILDNGKKRGVDPFGAPRGRD